MTRKVFVHAAELDGDGYPHDCPFNSRRAGKTQELAASLGLLEGPDRRVVAPERATGLRLEAGLQPIHHLPNDACARVA